MTKQRIRRVLSARVPRLLSPKSAGDAAVALILSGTLNPELTLCVKSAHLRAHANEVSLPGGKRELDDQSSLTCAIRETEEEIGVDLSPSDCLGALDQFQSLHGLRVTPWVFWPETPIQPRLHDNELQRVFQVPLADVLKDPDGFDFSARRQAIDQPYMPFWMASGERIWGLTALILAHFTSVGFHRQFAWPSALAVPHSD